MKPIESVNPTFRTAKLKDLVFFQRGFDITKAHQKDGPYPVISSSGTNSFHNEYKVPGPGIIIGRKGTLGSVHFSAGNYWPHDTTLWSKHYFDNNPRFIYYFLQTLNLAKFDVGSSNPTLNRNHIHDLEIKIPAPAIQRKIAGILSAYDDLIDNNRKRITLLEKAARLLYEEWFVRLQFPGHEHTPVVDGVPKGWENNTIRSCSEYVSRGISPSYDDESEGLVINQKCVRNNQVDLGLARNQKKPFKEEKQLVKGDVLINSTGTGTLGRVAQLWRTIPNCTVDSHVTIVRPKLGIGACWIGYQLSILEPILENMGEGSTNQKELGRDRIADLRIIIPSSTIQIAFEAIVSPTKDQILVLSAQNIRLQAARDLLLPRLMSGELAV